MARLRQGSEENVIVLWARDLVWIWNLIWLKARALDVSAGVHGIDGNILLGRDSHLHKETVILL